MKTLKLSRREFTRHAGLALLSVSGAAALVTASCSNNGNPTGPASGGSLQIDLAKYASLEQVGGGQAFDYEGTPIYVFRTGDAAFRALSRVCTHAGCTVSWNKSSDKFACPCHGSEFSEKGAVLRGPAKRALQEFTATYDTGTNILTIGG